MPVRIYVCGSLAIEDDSTVIPETAFPARQGRRLWTYLVLRRRAPVTRDALIRAIWGDEPPDGAESALNALVSRLRTTIRPITDRDPQMRITSDTGRYRLLLPPDAFVDFDRARQALHKAETADRTGVHDQVLAEARIAMEIADRGFLDGEEAPWILGERLTLHQTRIHAGHLYVIAEIRRGNLDLAEREADRLIAADPLWEASYRLMMEILRRRGNQAHAVRVMERCRSALGELGGLAPSPDTERALADVTAGRPVAELANRI